MSIYVLGVGIILSQFYFFSSGVPQPAHFLMIAPLLFYIMRGRRFVLVPAGHKSPKLLMVFFCYIAAVNFFYGVYLQDVKFVLPVVYFLYGLVVYFVTQNVLLYRESGLRLVSISLFFGLTILFAMAALGIGNYKFFPRYNAFFNDPNQMAFWALCVASMILSRQSINDLVKGVVFLFLFFIILKSASRSGLVGFTVLVLGFMLTYIRSALAATNVKKIAGLVAGVVIVLSLGYFSIKSNVDTIAFVESRVSQVDVGGQAGTRGYTRFIDHPEYMFLGAGQGAEIRFDELETEIHSTWAGLLFYYGIPGLLLMLVFIYKVSKKLSLSQNLIFAAPLLYSFTTLGYRTPIFWVFLAFFYCLSIIPNEQRRNKSANF